MGDGAECEMCQNCKRDIPVVNYRMHTLHCARNVVLCPTCDEPVPKSGVEEHNLEFHTEKECDVCNEKMTPNIVEEHKKHLCTGRMLTCKFCELDCRAGEVEEHEGYCGSRTEQCPECSDFVMLKDWEKHQKMTLYHELAKKPCSQVFGYDPRTQIGPLSSQKMPSSSIVSLPKSERKYSAIESPASNTSSFVPSRKYSVDSIADSYKAPSTRIRRDKNTPAKNGTNTSYLGRNDISSTDNVKGWGDANSYLSSYQRSNSNLNGTSHWPVGGIGGGDGWNNSGKISTTPNLMDDFPAADDDSSTMPPLEPLFPARLVSSLSFGTKSASMSIVDCALKRKNISPSQPEPYEEETLIPCEFCSETIQILKLIKHQTDCPRNMDSLYFNSHLSPNPDTPHTWPEVVTSALVGHDDVDDQDNHSSDIHLNSNSSLIELPSSSSSPPTSRLIDIDDLPPPLPPKTKTKAYGGARPKRKSEGSIVGRYLSKGSGIGQGDKDDVVMVSDKTMRSHSKPRQQKELAPSQLLNTTVATIESHPSTRLKESAPTSRTFLTSTDDPPLDIDSPLTGKTSDGGGGMRYQGSFSSKVNSNGYSTDRLFGGVGSGVDDGALFGVRSRMRPSHLDIDYSIPSRVAKQFRDIDPETDQKERDKLRDMLSTLRKDPFDEDLENNDGSYFPCEFCGDPYPVEFLMRHQLSCDLNPAPVTSGQGFDYSQIRTRAEENLELAKPPTG